MSFATGFLKGFAEQGVELQDEARERNERRRREMWNIYATQVVPQYMSAKRDVSKRQDWVETITSAQGVSREAAIAGASGAETMWEAMQNAMQINRQSGGSSEDSERARSGLPMGRGGVGPGASREGSPGAPEGAMEGGQTPRPDQGRSMFGGQDDTTWVGRNVFGQKSSSEIANQVINDIGGMFPGLTAEDLDNIASGTVPTFGQGADFSGLDYQPSLASPGDVAGMLQNTTNPTEAARIWEEFTAGSMTADQAMSAAMRIQRADVPTGGGSTPGAREIYLGRLSEQLEAGEITQAQYDEAVKNLAVGGSQSEFAQILQAVNGGQTTGGVDPNQPVSQVGQGGGETAAATLSDTAKGVLEDIHRAVNEGADTYDGEDINQVIAELPPEERAYYDSLGGAQ